MHLAELNIARLSYELDNPRIAEFVNNLDRINGIAERSPGFIWRLKDESGDATAIGGYDDPRIIVNLSVWETPQALENFVWQTVHKQFYSRRAEWFDVMDNMHFAMWWVEEGTEPTVEEARQRIEYLQAHGPSDYAFGWDHLPTVKLWKEARCA